MQTSCGCSHALLVVRDWSRPGPWFLLLPLREANGVALSPPEETLHEEAGVCFFVVSFSMWVGSYL